MEDNTEILAELINIGNLQYDIKEVLDKHRKAIEGITVSPEVSVEAPQITIPDSVEINNWPETQRVEVLNQPEVVDLTKAEVLLSGIKDVLSGQEDKTPAKILHYLEKTQKVLDKKVLDLLAEIRDKEPAPQEYIPASLISKDNRLKVEVDRAGGVGGSLDKKIADTLATGTAVKAADSPSIDAFGRWRVSEIETIFDSKQVFDSLPLLYDDQEVSGGGTSSTHDPNKAATVMAVSASTAGKRVRQSFMRMNYQPGKSQLILCTGTLGAGGTGITASMGYFDDNNGLFAMSKDGVAYFVKRSYYTGSVVDTEVAQADWNIDRFDGTGPSGVTLDPTKSQILFIDFEWLGVGRVRMGWVVDGKIYYAHEFNHANNQAGVYMSTPNLPIRYEIENDGTGVAAELEHICASVMSEGGVQNNGYLRHYDTGAVTGLANTAAYAVMGGRLKSTHLGATVLVENISVIGSANDQAHWELLIGGTVAGTFTYNDVTNSAVQIALGSSSNTVTGGTEIDGGYFTTNQGVHFTVPNALHLGAAIDGTSQEWQLVVKPITNNMTVRASVTWRELL